MKQVSEAVEEARRGLEQGWQQLGIGPEAQERSDFERKFLSYVPPAPPSRPLPNRQPRARPRRESSAEMLARACMHDRGHTHTSALHARPLISGA